MMASIRKIGSIAIALALSAMGVTAVAAEIKVMSAGAVQSMVTVLGAEFERETGNKLNLNFNTVGSLRDRLKGGETADLVILSASAIEALEQTGMFMPGSRTDLGRTVTGVVVQEGAPVPDITTPEGFKQALLAARTVAYTDPKAGGSSGTFFAGLLERLGIADAVNKKAVLGKRGHDVAQSIADGRAEIGTTFISEILPVQGVKVVGPLPGELHNANTYTAAIPAGSASREGATALLRKLTNPATRERWTAAGLEPAFK
jgi:molybdate transport system substrate-binding protein